MIGFITLARRALGRVFPQPLGVPVDVTQLEHYDATPGSARRAAFDAGLEPLPGWSFPPPRRTGWERDYQT